MCRPTLQRAAFDHAVGAERLALIEGRAGTGKSYTLAAVHDAYARDGKHVVGLAPTNSVAQHLAASGFKEASTAHAALFRLKNGRTSWDRNTVVVVDEAAMLDTRITGELLAAARISGAKLILAGDDRQLASVERGGLFTELKARHGAVEISEVTRQKVDWQRQAARDLAEGRFAEAVAAFDKAGAITWTDDQGGARKALVAAWTRDTTAQPEAKRFVFAYTNRDVDTLNAELRQVRRARGELGSPDVRLATKHGEADFAVGDRVQFTDTDKRLRIYNGNVGTIIGIDARTGELTAKLDSGREVSWSAGEFQGFRHGYAGTIYKAQGKTLDHTYLYHTQHWRAAASYVALTRQRDSAQVFVACETARDAAQLARQMARGEVKAASVAWATLEEIAKRPERQAAPEAHRATKRPEETKSWWVKLAEESDRQRDPLKARVRAALEVRQQQAALPAQEWLIPPYVSRDGRDSLGRGLDPRSIAAAVARDEKVREAKWEPSRHLRSAYRDPGAAQARLDELVAQEGWRGAARRIDADPEQLGRLWGRDGFLAGQSARQLRAHAVAEARWLAHRLARIVEAEQRAERAYRDSVTLQMERDKVGVPKLSAEAAATLDAVHAIARTEQSGGSRNRAAVAKAWEESRRNPAIAAEIDQFEKAAEQRLGEDGMRDTWRSAREGFSFFVSGLEPRHWQGLTEMARRLATARQGRTDYEAQRTLEAFRQRGHEQEHVRYRHGPSLGR
jgi:hypothetical protein